MFADILELIAPTHCASCNDFGNLLCDACLKDIQAYATQYACPRCGAPYGELVCTECWDETFNFHSTVALGAFEQPLSRAVITYKDENEQRLGRYLGLLLGLKARLMFGAWGDLITWVPPSAHAMKRRGFDHGELLAQGAQKALNLPRASLFMHRKNFDLRKLNKEMRKAVIQDGFSLKKNIPILQDKNIVVVDDVMTTGATLNEIAGMLVSAGAHEVRVAVLARTW